MKKLSEWIIRYRILVIIGFIGTSLFFASRIPDAEVESDMQAMLPPDMATRLALDKIEDVFGGTEMVMVVVEAPDILDPAALEQIKALSKKLERLKHVDRVLSIFTLKEIRGAGGEMVVDPAVKRIPKSEKRREKLRKRLTANDLVYGTVVARDFSATAIIGLLNKDTNDSEIVGQLRKLVDEVPGPGTLHIAGLPVTRTMVAGGIQGDMKKFLPYGLLIMLVFLFVCFRQLRGVVLPATVVVLSIMFAMGLVPVVGWKIQVITVLLPVILLAVANDYGIHLMARYQEINVPGTTMTKADMARDLIEDLAGPVILAGLTTMVGLLSLMSHITVPAKQLGILAGAGVLYAMLASLAFIPAVMSFLPIAKPVKAAAHGTKQGHLLDRLLHYTATVVSNRPRMTVGILVAITLLTASGIAKVNVDTNPVHYYSDENELVIASTLVDKHFGGSTTVSIMAEGDVKDPVLLNAMDDLEQKLRNHPDVGETTSIAKVVKEMNQALNNDDPAFEVIPDTLGKVAELFFLYEMSGDPEDFERMVDMNYNHALLTARVNSSSTKAISSVVDFTEAEMAKSPEGPLKMVGGFGPILSELADAIVTGQVLSLGISLLAVGLFVGLAFRSFGAGVLASIPLGLALMLLFGIMGWLQFDLNISTVMLSSIMIGVGVDYTIHFLWRYRKERAQGREPKDAIYVTLTTSGRGIVFNALSVVIGFAVLMISTFIPVKFFGLLVMVSISACLVGALALLPALVLIIRPRFLEPKGVLSQDNQSS
jgi:uncharacterized protein